MSLTISTSYLTNGNNTDIVYTLKTAEGKEISNLIIQTDGSGNPYTGTAVVEYLCHALISMSHQYNLANKAKTPLVLGNILIAQDRNVVKRFKIKHPGFDEYLPYEQSFGYYYYADRNKPGSISGVPSYFTTLEQNGNTFFVTDIKTGAKYEAFDVEETKTSGYHLKGVEWCSNLVLPHLSPEDPKAFMVALLALSMDDTVTEQEASALLGTAYNGIVNDLPNIKGLNGNNKNHLVEVPGALQNISALFFSSLGTGGLKNPIRPLSRQSLNEICFGIYKGRASLTTKQQFRQVSCLVTVAESIKSSDIKGTAVTDFTSANTRNFFGKAVPGRGYYLNSTRFMDADVALPYWGYILVRHDGYTDTDKKGKELEKEVQEISQAIRHLPSQHRGVLSGVALTGSAFKSDEAKVAMLKVNELVDNPRTYLGSGTALPDKVKAGSFELVKSSGITSEQKQELASIFKRDAKGFAQVSQDLGAEELIDWLDYVVFNEDNSALYLIYHTKSGKIAGLLSWTSRCFLPDDMRSAKLYIHPKLRGRGVGKTVTKAAMKFIPQGIAILSGVHDSNKASHALSRGNFSNNLIPSTEGYSFYPMTEEAMKEETATRIADFQSTITGESFARERDPRGYLASRR